MQILTPQCFSQPTFTFSKGAIGTQKGFKISKLIKTPERCH